MISQRSQFMNVYKKGTLLLCLYEDQHHFPHWNCASELFDNSTEKLN